MLQYRHILIVACALTAMVGGAACGFKFGKLKDQAKKKELSAHDVDASADEAVKASHAEKNEASGEGEHEDLTAESHGMGFFDKMRGSSREEILSCAKFLGGIPSEAFIYHMQAKIKTYQPNEERGKYLAPHFTVRGVSAPQRIEALNACADTILSVERFAEVQALGQMTPEQTLAFLEHKQRLSDVVHERFPLRSCGLFLGAVKTKKQFAKVLREIKEEPEQIMAAKLMRYNTAGANHQNRTITVRGCLTVLRSFHSLDDLNKFNLSSPAEQFELLTLHAIPVQYAH